MIYIVVKEKRKYIKMIKIINGKKYDTDTAVFIYNTSSGHSRTDFCYCEESLYLTKRGQFFLRGCGGGLSKYATHSGNSSGWGESLELLTQKEALDWSEQHSDSESDSESELISEIFNIVEG